MIYLDLVITVLSLLSMWLLVRLNWIGWPIAVASNILNLFLLSQARLYSNFVLEIYFFGMSLYGWILWRRQTDEALHHVNRLSNELRAISLAAMGLMTCVIYTLLQKTGSDSLFLDAVTTALSVVAQILLVRRYIETWAFWFLADLLYIDLYLQKGLPFHTSLMCCYLLLVLKGYRDWRPLLDENAEALPIIAS